MGFADHTDTDVAVLNAVSAIAAALIVAATLVAALRSDREPLALLAVGLGAVGLLAAPTQPWYLLWALAPFAATTASSRALRVTTAVTLTAALLLPPTGTDFVARGFELVNALSAAVVMLAVVLLIDLGRRRSSAVQGARWAPTG